MHAVFDHFASITPTVKTLWFRPERPVRYVAGQFTELFLPHDADERGVRRWFTLSSSPSEELLGITTRFESKNSSTFKQRLDALQPGTQLHLAEPMGDFVLPKNPAIPIVFVAAGLGITPVRSMVKWLQDTGEQRDVTLLYRTAESDEQAFAQLFNDSPLQYVPLVGQNNRLTADRILQALQGDPLIYISGPEQMVEQLYKELQTKGISPDRLVGDYFPGYFSA